MKPDYVTTGIVPDWGDYIEIKDEDQIQELRQACQLARRILLLAGKSLKVGMTTEEIDFIVHEETIRQNAYPSPLGYGGFPKSVCTSVNNVVCHGIPDSRPLQDGDIINIDVTVYLNGYHGDTSETFLVGNVDEGGRNFASRCRNEAITACELGALLSVIGNTVRQVKIWFQNKRSKFKKLLKQGGGSLESALANGRSLSATSPPVPAVWNATSSGKTSAGTAGTYIPSYTSWYPSAHQESMQQPQLM
ncbi:Methionine aminopeptidase 1D, mitochondrial [Acipenser ruthenus]|uniref:Methionine aminopeptidase 1D, mitochondrial n=1 Tax=Acipenser ruthenus TaxID=7906 RepID=A0A444U1N5_ACIRT|nr:Methionine aminopeptidase 1D, mitochondrial [Acipenser ruthenus]